jgi:NitT/TauT family transport system ATP-binding protein
MTIVHVTHDIDEAVYLADRVLVLSAAPGRVVGMVGVPLERPRAQTTTRSTPDFLTTRNRIDELIATKGGT